MLTLVGAFSKTILALVMIPNWPNPPKTAKNSSDFMSLEQVMNSPFPEPKVHSAIKIYKYITYNFLIIYLTLSIN